MSGQIERRMGTAPESELADFHTLLDAVLNQPDQVASLINQYPAMLTAVNNSAETVLHWLSVENHCEGIKLLHGLGAEIPEFALIHAAESGNIETVELLLSLGARLNRYSVEQIVRNPIWELPEAKMKDLEFAFSRYGKA